MTTVLDASALLVLLNDEPRVETVRHALSDAAISAVNLSEVVAKLVDAGAPELEILELLQAIEAEVGPFDEDQAYSAGLLRSVTGAHGLSLGDRACLALARR
jgi:PIN domain nuclease of toxin-antitoxin system